ncbi:hypothetical protein I317_00814 [Kwoniella heveanensis CBS 569]|nr:hypothetical protein I317_00814 [Kwoniella heveanensis CBS 569]
MPSPFVIVSSARRGSSLGSSKIASRTLAPLALQRQELDITWFKKKELDIKCQVSIRENCTTMGKELGKEFRQSWQPSRQHSPAPLPSSASCGRTSDFESKAALERLTSNKRASGARSPGGSGRLTQGSQQNGPIRDEVFAVGYAMGLIGGGRSWMQNKNNPTELVRHEQST